MSWTYISFIFGGEGYRCFTIFSVKLQPIFQDLDSILGIEKSMILKSFYKMYYFLNSNSLVLLPALICIINFFLSSNILSVLNFQPDMGIFFHS